MVLSVIIVNYNVKFFLEQCLHSVQKSLRQLAPASQPSPTDQPSPASQPSAAGRPSPTSHPSPTNHPSPAGQPSPVNHQSPVNHPSTAAPQTEILVVDNNSTDGSIEYLKRRFPGVTFIANKENKGFSAANNQALYQARGRYILFLNPDTILPEDAATTVIGFLEAHPEAGAAGVRMIDGTGQYLKESFRGYPTSWVAFCKLSGLTALFPNSKTFAGYYLGHLSNKETHPAPILSGACIWTRKEVLDKSGWFDERFFMYAEDIDLSYRIEQAGFTNYYIADATILHFKGESTRKDIKYIRIFYKAMSQFRRKHYHNGVANTLYNGIIETAIWLRAALTAIANPFRRSNFRPGSHRSNRTLLHPSDIILHEGPTLSFKDCIATIEAAAQPAKPAQPARPAQPTQPVRPAQPAKPVRTARTAQSAAPAPKYKIHASGSDSAVGASAAISTNISHGPSTGPTASPH